MPRRHEHQIALGGAGESIGRRGAEFDLVVGGDLDVDPLLALLEYECSSQSAKCGVPGNPAHKSRPVSVVKCPLLREVGGNAGHVATCRLGVVAKIGLGNSDCG